MPPTEEQNAESLRFRVTQHLAQNRDCASPDNRNPTGNVALRNVRKRPPSTRAHPEEAEEEGFEPPEHYCSTVFKTAAFDRSAIPPWAKVRFFL